MTAFIITLFSAQAQDTLVRKTRFPVGLYTTDNSTIYGLSIGIGSDTYQDGGYVGVRSNGIRIEPLSQSLLVFTLIFPIDRVKYPTDASAHAAFAKKVPNEIINGLNISCGTNAFANVNGITLSALTQSLRVTNGISIAGLYSQSFKNNGMQLSALESDAVFSNGLIAAAFYTRVHTGRGLQVSVITNGYKNFTGLQVGLLNGMFSNPESFTGVQIGLFNRTKKLRGLQIGLWNINEKRSLPFVNW